MKKRKSSGLPKRLVFGPQVGEKPAIFQMNDTITEGGRQDSTGLVNTSLRVQDLLVTWLKKLGNDLIANTELALAA